MTINTPAARPASLTDQQITDQQLAVAVGDMATDMADTTHERDQADNKATALLGGTVAALTAELAALIGLAGRLGPWGIAALLGSVALLISATGVLAGAIRPAAASGGQLAHQWGHVRYARLSPVALLAHYLDQAAHPLQRAQDRATALHCQARRVVRKYTLVRRGVDLGAAALVLAAAAAVLAALT